MSRNVLFATGAVLALATAALGYQYYQYRTTSGIAFNVGDRGSPVEKK